MSLYNMLFGMNPQADLLLAVIGLKKNDVERFRDAFKSEDGSEITIRTRTGGGNRKDYPNLEMRKRPEWTGSVDDDYDNTYCDDTFRVPEQWREDVRNLGDFRKGMRAEFAEYLAVMIGREPTESDAATAAYEAESAALRRTDHFMANGHTFVPNNDAAMIAALKIAENNDGKLRTAMGILPLVITVRRDFIEWPNALGDLKHELTRIKVDYEWKIDTAYWEHCQRRFAAAYPITMAKIAEDVRRHNEKAA